MERKEAKVYELKRMYYIYFIIQWMIIDLIII